MRSDQCQHVRQYGNRRRFHLRSVVNTVDFAFQPPISFHACARSTGQPLMTGGHLAATTVVGIVADFIWSLFNDVALTTQASRWWTSHLCRDARLLAGTFVNAGIHLARSRDDAAIEGGSELDRSVPPRQILRDGSHLVITHSMRSEDLALCRDRIEGHLLGSSASLPNWLGVCVASIITRGQIAGTC